MKDIKGYEGIYFACPTGKIFAIKSNKLPNGGYLKPWLIGRGYEMVMLYSKKTPKKFLVHRLIASTFISNPNCFKEVNHINGDKLDNRPENLEWVSSSDNKSHAWNNGLYTHMGSNHYLAKLNESKVRKIRSLAKTGKFTNVAIAKMFNVSAATIGLIIMGKIWKHIL